MATEPHAIDYTSVMMEHTPVSMVLYDTKNFRMLAVNRAMFQSLATYFPGLPYHGDEIIGQPLTAWFPPTGIQEMTAIFRSVAESGIPYRRVEYPIRLPDGDTAYWNWSLHPIADEQGHVLYLLHSAIDVTGEVKARIEAHKSQTEYIAHPLNGIDSPFLRAMLDHFPEGVLIADVTTGSTIYANEVASRLLGISQPLLMRMPLHQHIWSHSNDAKEATDLPFFVASTSGKTTKVPWLFPVVHALCGETIKAQETFITRPDGSTLNVLTSSIPLRTEQGFVVGVVVIFQDISSQKNLDQQRQDFFYTASHELRTPITAIQGLAELLQLSISKGQMLDSSRVERILGRLSEQSQQLAHLVGELLDVSLIEQGQFTLDRVRCDLLPLVVRGVEYFTTVSISLRHSIHLSLEGPVATGTLTGRFDKERIVQVLHNLINNAIKYSPSGGHVEVTLRHMPDTPHEVSLLIQDEGLGIAAQDLPHIFERFYRGATVDKAISGLGIGLYLANEIVVRHGGRVRAESVEGHGATFHVVLPLEDRRE